MRYVCSSVISGKQMELKKERCRMKKAISVLLLLCLLSSLVIPAAVADGPYTAGTYTGTAQGFGGEVSVTITVDSDAILTVEAEGPNETAGVGSRAVELLPAAFIEAQNADVDAVSGATSSSRALIQAIKQALAQAKGEDQEETAVFKMAPGKYTAVVSGYSKTRPMKVDVTITDYAVTKIEIGENKENVGILGSVKDLLIPRIIERQSVDVDAICGATVSSNAVKRAVEDCMQQAMEAAGTDLDQMNYFHKEYVPEKSEETIDVDVLVVGMGGSGSAAAMMAVDTQQKLGQEVSVLAIDKAGKFGGTACNTSVMLAFDSKYTQDTYNNGEPYFDKSYCDEEFRSVATMTPYQEMGWNKMLNESGYALDFLISHGFYFGEPKPGLAGEMPNSFEYTGQPGEASLAIVYTYFQQLWDDFTRAGGKYMLETEGTDLIVDPESGAVTGVKAINHVTGVEYTINAKSVVLCCGGFGANDELEEELYRGSQTGAYKHDISIMQNDGKMMVSALKNGAAVGGMEDCLTGIIWNFGVPYPLTCYDINWVDGTFDIFRDDTGCWSFNDVPNIMVSAWEGVAVNPEGNRYTNEAGIFTLKMNNGSLYYSLWSKDLLDYINESGFGINFAGNFINSSSMTSGAFPLNTGIKDMGMDVYEIMEKCVETGNAIKADTLEELAELAGMDPAVLAETVKKYDEGVESGNDEFGKDPVFMHKIGSDGPFYFLLGMPRPYTSGGGLLINDKLQVLSATDMETPIEGLFAGGTDCLGATPPPFYGGEQLCWAMTSGRGAGRSAARYAAGETLEYEEEYAEVTRAVTAVNTQVASAAMDFFKN